MLDFLTVSHRISKRGNVEVYPTFVIKKNISDLMIRGSDFYAIWVEERGQWSTDEADADETVVDESTESSTSNNEEDALAPIKNLIDTMSRDELLALKEYIEKRL